jgi:pyrroline-5-carboxylate reductase
MNEPVIGFIGTGQFSAYLIAALRRGGHKGEILLSPHSRSKAEEIARQHNCIVAADNAELIGAADWLVIAVRPEQLDVALAQISGSPPRIIISAVAGVPVAEIRCRVSCLDVFRIMPASYIQFINDGLVPLFPPSGPLAEVFAKAGYVFPFFDEEDFELALAGSCISGWMYSFMGSLEKWFLERGFSPKQARLVVSQNIAGAAALAKANCNKDLKSISDAIATEGTYTKLGLDFLESVDAAAPWQKALGLIQDKLERDRT